MTRPYERWHRLWQLFIALDLDWTDGYATEKEAVEAATEGWTNESFTTALEQWHDAFDGASDDEINDIVSDFNPMYDPQGSFGGAREWADWVRAYLEQRLVST
jgi:hypothetical protein